MTTRTTHLTDGTEQPMRTTPPLSLVLAYAGVAPIVAGAALSRVLPPPASRLVAGLATGWAGAILCFLGGVRRGLAFRQPGGTTVSEAGAMLTVFSAGAGGTLLPHGRAPIGLLLGGYVLLALLDRHAAHEGEAPRYFARLRPPQSALAAVSLLSLLLDERRS